MNPFPNTYTIPSPNPYPFPMLKPGNAHIIMGTRQGYGKVVNEFGRENVDGQIPS